MEPDVTAPADVPVLSVVLVSSTGLGGLARTLAAIAAQTIAERIEVLIVVPDEDGIGRLRRLLARFHSTDVMSAGTIPNVDHAVARVLLKASAPIVAAIEDHAFPEPDWAERVLAAFDDGCVAVGSAMLNANPSGPLSWSNMLIAYGQWSEATREGEIAWVALHNGTFRRSALERFGETLPELFNREGGVLLRLREAGGRFRFAPRARIRHLNPSRLSSTARLRFDAGRLTAANRARDEGWSRFKRGAYAVLGPAIPALRYLRMRKELFGRQPGITEVRHGPALLIGLVFDAAGQIAGFLSGPGGARDRLAVFEMNRLDHLESRDLERFGIRS